MKTPKFLTKLSAILSPRPKKRYQATARVARPSAMSEYDEEEPTTKLSSAFIVVLVLHLVAVGGIWAFNEIKASRRSHEAPVITTPETTQNPPNAAPAAATAVAKIAPVSEVPLPAAITTNSSRTYQVRAGDNLTKIAFLNGVNAAELMEANGLKDSSVLRPGQVLRVPAKTSAKAAQAETGSAKKTDSLAKTSTATYTVKKGDNVVAIARTLGIDSSELLKLNKIADPKKLQPGQTLKLPAKHN